MQIVSNIGIFYTGTILVNQNLSYKKYVFEARMHQESFQKTVNDSHLWYVAWYGMSLLLVFPEWNQSSVFSFALLKVLFALSQTEPIFKAVEYRGKLARLYFPEGFSLIETIRSLFHAFEDVKVVPLVFIVLVCTRIICYQITKLNQP